jgi:hypothetical protein
MARHSSFENLVALETCQNFFLIAGLSTEFPSHEPGSGQPEGATHDALPHQKVEGTRADSAETASTRPLEE